MCSTTTSLWHCLAVAALLVVSTAGGQTATEDGGQQDFQFDSTVGDDITQPVSYNTRSLITFNTETCLTARKNIEIVEYQLQLLAMQESPIFMSIV